MIMHDIVELSAQIGGMHSKNHIINFVYKLRKKKMLKEIISRIDKLPDIPSDEDIQYFSHMIPKWLGMDFDGDVHELAITDDEYCSIYFNVNMDMVRYVYINDMIYDIIIRENGIASISCKSNGVYINNLNTTEAYKCIGKVIKTGLKKVCTNMILGGK